MAEKIKSPIRIELKKNMIPTTDLSYSSSLFKNEFNQAIKFAITSETSSYVLTNKK